MRIISWNVNGIRAVHKKGLFDPFIKKYKPDILLLQETKAEEHESPIDLPDYDEYWNSSKARKGYSGTAIFTKMTPENVFVSLPKEIEEKYGLHDDPYGNPNEEGRVLVADMQDFYVASVYTPNAKDDLSRVPLRHKKWDPAFLEYMTLLQEEKPVIFGGDLNVAHTELDLARPRENNGKKGFTEEEREGVNNIIKAGFVDTFRQKHTEGENYTWWSNWGGARERNVGWRIDYLFASKEFAKHVKSAEILPEVMGSDHCPVSITI